MTVTREELHALVDRLKPDELERVARTLSALRPQQEPEPPWPRSFGMIKGADPKASEQVDQHLARRQPRMVRQR